MAIPQTLGPAPPTASGAITREAAKLLRERGADPTALLRNAGISIDQLDTPEARIPAQRQINFLNLAAEYIGDELLGIHLAARFEPREAGLFYFVLASAKTLREALRRLERYTCLVNDGVHLTCLEAGEVGVRCAYAGLSRHSDRHQVEFILTMVSKIVSQITGLRVRPSRMSFSHPAFARQKEAEAIIGCEIDYAASRDEVVFESAIGDHTLISADPYLNKLLVSYCEEALADKSRPIEALSTRVENAIVPLLPHGRGRLSEVARTLGMSERSLARQLAFENLSFSQILGALRLDLARYYLRSSDLSVTEIAWLLGFKDPTAFTHAFKRWAGKPPATVRKQSTTSPDECE